MSAKQAKRLRQAARGLAVVLDESGKKIHKRGLNYIEYREASPSSVSFRSDVSPKEAVDDPNEAALLAVQAVNRPDSLRGIIRTLKKGMRTGQIGKLPPKATNEV